MANSANPEINKKIATSALGTLVIATVFFYLGDRYAETLVTYPGQIFDHLSDAFLSMDFSSYYYYIPLNFYETPEMTLIDHEPNGDSATVLVLALAKIHTRTVTKNDDGTFTIVTDDGTFTDTEVMDMLSSFGYRANHAKYTHALAVVARFPPFDHLAYSEAERDKKTPEVYQ